MLYMLRRNYFFNKRRERKQEVDKTQALIKQWIEMNLKQLNKRSDSEILDLQNLKLNYAFNWHEPVVLNQFQSEMREYIIVQNEYLKNKSLEERAKQKKPKVSVKQKYEQTSFEAEIDRVLKEITVSLPE